MSTVKSRRQHQVSGVGTLTAVSQRIFGNLSLRPTKVAFFVSPSDASQLQRAMEVNTCLWGGLRNPILPYPFRLNRRILSPSSPLVDSELIDAVIRNLEPEILVVPDPKSFATSALVKDREVVGIDDLLARVNENRPRIGVSMFHVYRSLWEDSFRFEHRVKTRFVTPEPPFEWPLFIAATWGAFPPESETAQFAGWYDQVVSPEKQAFTAESFHASYVNEWRDPLGLTLAHTRSLGRSDAYIMLLRPKEPLDVMAFWTLRAIGHYVIPVPLEWRDAMLPLAKQLVKDSTVPNREYVTVCRGPRTPFRLVREYAKAASSEGRRALASQWYPRLWSNEYLRFDNNGSSLEADTATVEAACDKARVVRIRTLTPKFIERLQWAGGGRWTNCFEPWGDVEEGSQSLVVPANLTNLHKLCGLAGRQIYLSIRRGILFGSDHPDSLQWMKIPTGSAVIHHWLRESGLETRVSSAGNAAHSLAKAMGGPGGMYWLGYPLLIESLNHIASLPGKHVKAKQSIERDIQAGLDVHKEGLRTKEEVFEWLLKRGALRLGLAASCTACQQQNWYPLDKLRYRVPCDRCGKKFAFPEENPKQAWWAYSLAGPFSVPNFVSGGYGAVAALHAISRNRTDGCMWAFGIECKEKASADSPWHEIDVIAMVRENADLIPVFVEAKSGIGGQGGFISDDEIARAEYLLNRFPTAVVVFSTMAPTFEAATTRRLRAFVERLHYRTIGRFDSAKPVALFGQCELFGTFALSEAWRHAGGKRAKFAEKWPNVHSMLSVCAATQALHLYELPESADIVNT